MEFIIAKPKEVFKVERKLYYDSENKSSDRLKYITYTVYETGLIKVVRNYASNSERATTYLDRLGVEKLNELLTKFVEYEPEVDNSKQSLDIFTFELNTNRKVEYKGYIKDIALYEKIFDFLVKQTEDLFRVEQEEKEPINFDKEPKTFKPSRDRAVYVYAPLEYFQKDNGEDFSFDVNPDLEENPNVDKEIVRGPVKVYGPSEHNITC